jgi:hypothetical protein
MTLIDTQDLVHGPAGAASRPRTGANRRAAEGASRPSGASAYRVSVLSPTERALMGTLGRPWA